MTAMWLAFVGGLSGSAHCLGMCGPFALHWAGGGRSVARQLFWHAGRITAYTFLGCLAGFAGSRILLLPYAGTIGRTFAYAAALVMLLSAMRLLGWLPVRQGSVSLAGVLAPILQGMLHEKSLAAPAVTGMLCGFLPCPMTWGFLAVAVATSSVVGGGAVMAALGLGTLAPLLLLGLSGRFVLGKLGRFARPAGAIVLTAVAATMILRPSAIGQCLLCQQARVQPVARPTTTAEGGCATNANPGGGCVTDSFSAEGGYITVGVPCFHVFWGSMLREPRTTTAEGGCATNANSPSGQPGAEPAKTAGCAACASQP